MINSEVVRNFERVITEYKGLSYKIDFINKEIEIVKNDEYSKDDELIKLNKDLNKYIRLKNMLNMCLNNLNGIERKLIELRYLSKEKLTWKQIAGVVGFSEDYCRKEIKFRAINKIIDDLNNCYVEVDKYI